MVKVTKTLLAVAVTMRMKRSDGADDDNGTGGASADGLQRYYICDALAANNVETMAGEPPSLAPNTVLITVAFVFGV